jgi:glycerophosphoryl diester phosphodiesterase
MAANPFLAPKARPLVVGHRGVPALHQENTIAGFRRAEALGVPAVELDVRLTKDKLAIVCHDPDLGRLTGLARDVDELTWDQISRLRIRRELPMGIDAHGERKVVHYAQEERIPLFAEVLAAIPKTAINIELKLDLKRWWPLEVSLVTAQLVAEARAEDRVIATSFDPRKLRAAVRANPRLAIGFCYDDTMLDFARPVLDRLPIRQADGEMRPNARRALTAMLDANIMGRLLGTVLVGAEHTLVGPRTVELLHKRGVAIGTHTIFPLGSSTGKPIAPSALMDSEAYRLADLGVDWIETDDAERLMKLIY